MAITFNQFFSAIAEQESNGRYNAVGVPVNGNRAYGKYQIMDFNIPSWTAKYYGKRLTVQQFLNSPAAQEATARGKLQEYFKRYGARGAASAWYSGNPSLHNSTKSQPGGPSIKGYVDSVLAKAAKYPAGGGTSSGGVSGAATGNVPEARNLSAKELAESYGFMQALLNSTPELKALFAKATKGQWTADKFQAELRDTKWFKTHSKTEREYLTKMYGDPATAKQEIAQAQLKVTQMAQQMGVTGKALAGTNMKALAYKVVALGWTDQQVRFYLGRYVAIGDSRTGEAGELEDAMREYAYNMGVAPSDTWWDSNIRNVAKGVATKQDIEDSIRKLAKSQYSQWSKQIDSGQSVADIASPYMQSMAQLLELPAGSVNLFDKTIKTALNYKDPQSGASAIKPLWQFENELRNDDRWRKTKNAQDSMMQTAHQVLADFGVKY